MKKTILGLFLVLFGFALVGCKAKEKTFTKIGVSITLTEQFVEKEVIQTPFYLESRNHIFTAVRESKEELDESISSLETYINAVLTNNNKTGTVLTKEEDNVTYMYAYYEATVNDQTFGYMLLAFEGEDHFYSMNFGCLESKLESNKEQYFKWASTITIE